MNKELNLSHKVLSKVYFDHAYASIELNRALESAEELNKATVTKIVYGVIEKDVSLEYIANQFCKNAPSDDMMLLLKMGTYIGLFLNSIPKYTIVNELVNIAKTIDIHKSGFINATLKNILSGSFKLPKESDTVTFLSVKYSYPRWIVERYISEFGVEKTRSILSQKLTTDTHIRVNQNEISIREFLDILDDNMVRYEKSLYDDTFVVDYAKLMSLKLSHCYVVQGLPSIITVRNLGLKPHDKVLDVCSAPGGKTVLTAMDEKDCNVLALDIHEHRVKLVRDYAKYMSLDNVQVGVNDATKLNKDYVDGFDKVICDVPCSGLGVVSKKPDILLNRTPENINELNDIQKTILEVSAQYVKKGGTIVYSTCSILPSENERIVQDFLSKHTNFVLQKVDTKGIKIYNLDEMVTFSPEISGVEGFFIAKLLRKE